MAPKSQFKPTCSEMEILGKLPDFREICLNLKTKLLQQFPRILLMCWSDMRTQRQQCVHCCMHTLGICQERSKRLDHPGIDKLAKFGNIRCPPADILSCHYSTRLHAARARCLFLCICVHMCAAHCARARTHTHTHKWREIEVGWEGREREEKGESGRERERERERERVRVARP